MTEKRPQNCRFRLIDEKRAYPKSRCFACGKSALEMGKKCTVHVSDTENETVKAEAKRLKNQFDELQLELLIEMLKS